VIVAPILGTIMKLAALSAAGNLKDQLLANPQALAGEAAMKTIQAKFAAFGPEGEALFRSFLRAVQGAPRASASASSSASASPGRLSSSSGS